jgi:hypothetical protein
MKKDKTAFHRLKLFTGITLCYIMTSCNGQANIGYKQNVIKKINLYLLIQILKLTNLTIRLVALYPPYYKTVKAIFGLELKMVRLNYLEIH